MSKITMNLFFVLFTCALCAQITQKPDIQTLLPPSTTFGDTFAKVNDFLSKGVRVLVLYTDSGALNKIHPIEWAAIQALAGEYSTSAKFRLVTWLMTPDLQNVFNKFKVGPSTASLTYIVYNNGNLVAQFPNDIYKVRRHLQKLIPN